MAKNKTVKFNENTTISITPKSKSLAYEYTGNTSYSFQINNEFISDGKFIDGYKSHFQNIATKSGNNLVITSLFSTNSGKIKKITTTIKNYFINPASDYEVNFDSYRYLYEYGDYVSSYTVTPNTPVGTKGLYTVMNEDATDSSDFILGTKKNDIITVTSGGADFIYNEKGNDTYKNESGDDAYVYDLKGNDNYNISAQSKIYAYEYEGNDKYFVDDDGSYLMAQDYKGNDTYKINSINGESSSDFWIDDYKGKDKYYITSNLNPTYNNITDHNSNDKYYLTNATAEISDTNGKDYYEIKNNTEGNALNIIDSKSNDTYKISNSNGIIYGNLSVSDSEGNDKHIWNNVAFNSLSPEEIYAIEDIKGNDKYTLRDVKNIRIYDGSGKDKYDFKNLYDTTTKTFTSVSDFQITDYGNKNDKYDLQFVSCEYAEDDETSRTIIDDGGNDKYTLATSSGIRINDKSGNDTYNLKAPVDKKGKKIKFESEEAFAAINGKSEIYDDKGNDKYNISYAMGAKIYDSEGKDTYNIKGSTISQSSKITEEITLDLTIPTVSMLEIHDTSTTSADTYNITNVTGSSGMIGLGLFTPVITDDGGNNKFNIKNAGSYINLKEIQEATENKDKGKLLSLYWSMPSFGIRCMGVGNDKYNIKNSFLMTSISDSKGNDKYSFKNVSGSIIASDNEGNDKYTISKNKAGIQITDNSGNDTYTLDKLKKTKVGTFEGAAGVLINDKEGNDTLKISSLKKSNIIYMANFSNDASTNYMDSQDFGLIIYDKKNGGLVNLVDFYETTETQITGLKNSIETLKAGKKSINLAAAAGDYSKMETLKEQVGAWLNDGGRNFDDVQQVLLEGSKEDIASLVQMFQTGM